MRVVCILFFMCNFVCISLVSMLSSILRFFFLSAISFCLVCCSGRDAGIVLNDVEGYIADRPDSALAVLRSMDMESIAPASLRAKYSLLHSQALDKCYIDLKSDSIITPAVKYYRHSGSADDRLKMCYYYARIFENSGDNVSALLWLSNGERYISKCRDYSSAGRLYTAKSRIYYNAYYFDSALSNSERALSYYRKGNDRKREIVSLLDNATALIYLQEYTKADSTIQILNGYVPDMTDANLGRYAELRLIESMKLNSPPEAIQEDIRFIYEYVKSPYNYPTVFLARAYNRLGMADSARFYISQYEKNEFPSVSDNSYYMALSDVLALEGDYHTAFDNERRFISYEMSDLYKRMQSDIKFVEERTRAEYEAHLTRVRGWMLFLLFLLAVCAFAAVSCLLIIRLKRTRRTALQTQEKLTEIESELDILQGIAQHSIILDDRMTSLLDKRITTIQKVLLMRKEHSHVQKDIALLKLDELVEDQKSFLGTLSLLYSVCHQQFMAELISHELTWTEIGYCCLYMLGYDIQGIIELLNTKNAYNINSSIRKKLGIQDIKTTLQEYLHSLPQ